MTTVNPQSVVVSAEIDFHTAIKAVVEFAEKYPVERMSITQMLDVDAAANTMHRRIREHVAATQGTDYE